MLSWLPAPETFREHLRAASNASRPEDRLGKLVALAHQRLDFVQTIQVDRALGHLAGSEADGLRPVRLAILASSTVNHLAAAIRVAGLRRRLMLDVHVGAFGQYRQELLDASSPLRHFGPQLVLLSLTAREVLASTPLTATHAEVDLIVGRTVDELRGLWRQARETLKATVIQQTFLNVADSLFGSYDRMVAAAPTRLIARLNDRLAEAATAEGVLLLDLARASERDGLDAWFDTTRWLQAKVEVAPQAAPMYGELVVRVIAAHFGASRKCLVFDLDNTLWGGVIGDDGLEGIVLGEGSAAGEAYLALQRYAKRLRDRGVILAVCSKNDLAVAEAVFRDHPEMLLTRSDIAAFVANWDDKAANLKLISSQLNIGVDSLVFVDDNPVERARIRQCLPDVAVPELPSDAGQYVRCLADAGYFEAIGFTTDDRQRADQYVANACRDAFLGTSQSVNDFLAGLDMSVETGPFRPVDFERVAQLINKTNQFTPTTTRHSVDAVRKFAAADITLQFRLVDRFGDNGLVSAMILRASSRDPCVFALDTWVMSCRVFGRELEQEAMNIAVETVRRRGGRTVCAEYIPTPRNGIVSTLYAGLGFARASAAVPGTGTTRWVLCLDDYAARCTHIRRSSRDDD